MIAKMDLGRRIVADFHSPADAEAAFSAFDREVRQGLEPSIPRLWICPAKPGRPRVFA